MPRLPGPGRRRWNDRFPRRRDDARARTATARGAGASPAPPDEPTGHDRFQRHGGGAPGAEAARAHAARLRRRHALSCAVQAHARSVRSIWRRTGADHRVGIRRRPRPVQSNRADPFPRLRLGFLGSLMVSKAPHVLLEAVGRLPRGAVSVDLFGSYSAYHGDDRYRHQLEPLLKQDGVMVHGAIAHDRVAQALSSIDVLVVPSIWPENSPLVIQEAFLAGVPVVASRIGGIPEAIDDGRNGLLFRAGDVRRSCADAHATASRARASRRAEVRHPSRYGRLKRTCSSRGACIRPISGRGAGPSCRRRAELPNAGRHAARGEVAPCLASAIPGHHRRG